MTYSLTFRWLKFALVAMLGTLATAILLTTVLSWAGYRPGAPFVFFGAFIPFAIWYLRRTARDRTEFEIGRREDAAPLK